MDTRISAIFLIKTGNTFFEQIWSENQNYQLKLKFSTQTNSNMKNSVVVFNFSILYQERHF